MSGMILKLQSLLAGVEDCFEKEKPEAFDFGLSSGCSGGMHASHFLLTRLCFPATRGGVLELGCSSPPSV
jgi:hypothetical protein